MNIFITELSSDLLSSEIVDSNDINFLGFEIEMLSDVVVACAVDHMRTNDDDQWCGETPLSGISQDDWLSLLSESLYYS